MVNTFAANRRQDMGNGNWREHGELIPEAHTWFGFEHYLHTGEITEVQVEEPVFLAAVEKFCPQLADQVRELTGITEITLEGTHNSPRVESLHTDKVGENMKAGKVVRPARKRAKATRPGPARKQSQVTIQATDIRPGIPTPELRSGANRSAS